MYTSKRYTLYPKFICFTRYKEKCCWSREDMRGLLNARARIYRLDQDTFDAKIQRPRHVSHAYSPAFFTPVKHSQTVLFHGGVGLLWIRGRRYFLLGRYYQLSSSPPPNATHTIIGNTTLFFCLTLSLLRKELFHRALWTNSRHMTCRNWINLCSHSRWLNLPQA